MEGPSTRLRKLAVSISLISCAGCVTPAISPLTEGGHQFGASDEEKKLLARAGQLHKDLDSKGLLLEQPESTRYIEQVGRPLVARETAGVVDFRFHILRVPIVNAFALPNGDIYLTVGLLARLDSEAELAQVLGHEISHVVLRHSLKSYETRRSNIIAANIADMFLFGTSIAYLPFMASLASFSREQEEEADRVGMQSATAAGYDPEALLQIFAAMKEVKKGEEIRGSAYSSHPTSRQRAETLRAMVQSGAIPSKGLIRKGDKDYAPFRARIMAENIRLKLNARQYELARDAADAAVPLQAGSAWPHYYLGEAYRQMGDDPRGAAREHAWLYGKANNEALVAEFEQRRNELYSSAEQAYRQALTANRDFVLAERGLGLVHLRRGENDAAREKLGNYLAKERDARDRQYINNLLKGIGQ